MDILTPDQFTAAAPTSRRNYALKRGGSLTVGLAAGKILITSDRELTAEQLTEAKAIVADFTARQAKLAKERAIDAPQAARGVTPTK